MTTYKIIHTFKTTNENIRFVEIDGKIKYKIVFKERLIQNERLLNVVFNLEYTPKVIKNNKNNIMVEYIDGKILSEDEYDKYFDTFIKLSNDLFNKEGITYFNPTRENFVRKGKIIYWIDFDSFQNSVIFDLKWRSFWRNITLRKHLINGNFRQFLLDSKNFLKYDPSSYIKFLKYKS